jgi:hypothetical protein
MNTESRKIQLDRIPAMTGMLVKAATTRKKKQADPTFVPLTITAQGVHADIAKLAKFREVCDFEPGNTLPLPYPHIMAFALHMQLMLEPEFPLSPMGAVHIRNRIRQKRAIRSDEAMDFEVRLGETQRVEKGYEVSIITEVSIAGDMVWDDLSVMLLRRGGTGAKKERKPPGETPHYRESVRWQLAANKGRQYKTHGFQTPDHARHVEQEPQRGPPAAGGPRGPGERGRGFQAADIPARQGHADVQQRRGRQPV